jgi:TRIAD3 protein (E3 ubiquitin-protein ligase RNF216)
LNNELYAPTHIQLTTEMESDVPPFTVKATKTKTPMGKGKEREMQDEDFEREKTWLLLKDVPVIQEFPVARSLQDQAPGGSGTPLGESNVLPEDEGGLECGCCFSPAPFVCIPHSYRSEPIN